MSELVDALQHAVDQPDGGALVVPWKVESAGACLRQVASWCLTAGFIPIAPPAEIDAVLPATLRHRHVLMVCDADESVATAIRWMRALARTSPRRHVIVAPPQSSSETHTEWSAGSLDPAIAARERRALTWQRRGRTKTGDRWFAAASEAARRRGDVERAIDIDLTLIASLIGRGCLDEARRRLHQYLAPSTAWLVFARAAALYADVLISRLEWGAVVAWTNSLIAENVLRGDRLPGQIAARVAELDFWLGRPIPAAKESDMVELDRAAWRALRRLSGGDRSAAVDLVRRLRTQSHAEDCQRDCWLRILEVLIAKPNAQADLVRSALELGELAAELNGTFRRRARLAISVAARALLVARKPDKAAALLRPDRGYGPEQRVCLRLARAESVQTPRADAPGIEWLSSWRNQMHLIDGLPSLLAVLEEADEEHHVLSGSCRWLCERGAARAAIVSADETMFLAGEGWRAIDLTAELASVARDPTRDIRLSPDNRDMLFAVSIRSLGTTVASLIVLSRSSDPTSLHLPALTMATLIGAAVRARLDAIAAAARARHGVAEIVGDSPLMVSVRDAIARAAAAPFPVLIEGESGTGKELVARALHRLGARRDRKLNAVNCAALTDELVEAELFGHTKGAFTGAVGARTGLFEESHGGTLFLDEVTELSPRAQAKLLRVLQEGEIRRVGENLARPVDVRVIAACNVAMADAVADGSFRDDLRYRLAVIRIALPPLRERVEDIPSLALAFWRRATTEAGTRAVMGPDALARLTHYTWPGNVRELQNVIAGMVVASPPRGRVTARHVEQVLTHAKPVAEIPGVKLEAARKTFERRVIMTALSRHAGRRHAAAAELGLTRQGLAKALRRLGLAGDEQMQDVA